MSAEIQSARNLASGGVRVGIGLRFELDGQEKPVCVATVNFVYFP
jgi:hypothetical protein